MASPTKVERERSHPPLSSAQREQLRRALEARKARLLRIEDELREQATEAHVEDGDVADVAEGVIEDRDRAAIDEHDRTELDEIEHALSKVAAGTYGLSEKSGRPIAFERLLAVPWTRYDAHEAERVEHDARR